MVATTEGREMEIMGIGAGVGVGVGAASSLKNKNHPTTHPLPLSLPLAPLQFKLLNGGYAVGTAIGKKYYN